MSAVQEPLGLESRPVRHLRRNAPSLPQTLTLPLRALRPALPGLQDSSFRCPAPFSTAMALSGFAPATPHSARRSTQALFHFRAACAGAGRAFRFTTNGSLAEPIAVCGHGSQQSWRKKRPARLRPACESERQASIEAIRKRPDHRNCSEPPDSSPLACYNPAVRHPCLTPFQI
jgi:hypothetical protein